MATTPDPELTGGAGNKEDTEPGPAGAAGAPVEAEEPNSGQGSGSNTAKDPAPNFPEGTVDPETQAHPSSSGVDQGGEAGESGTGSSSPTGTPDPEQTHTGTHVDPDPARPTSVEPEEPNSGEGGSPRQADYPAAGNVTPDPEMPQQG